MSNLQFGSGISLGAIRDALWSTLVSRLFFLRRGTPTTPPTGYITEWYDEDGNKAWVDHTGKVTKIASSATATATIPATGTVAMRNTVNTFSEAQTFSGVITAPGMKPASNSTNALEFENAGGTPILTVDTTNSKVITAGDLFARNDTYGLLDRLAHNNVVPTDHFTAFTGWTWADTSFATPNNISVATIPSVLRLVHNSTTDNCFAYQSGTQVFARCFVGLDSYVGVRVDDGTTDNSIELRVQASSAASNSLTIISTVAATPTSTTVFSGLVPSWFTLQVIRTSTVAFAYMAMNGPDLTYQGGATGLSWTATRAGIIFGQRSSASSFTRAGFFDWARIA